MGKVAGLRVAAGVLTIVLCAAGAYGANPGLATVPNNTWVKLSPTPIPRYIGTNYVFCNQQAPMGNPVGRSFTGMVAGEGKLFYWGGGHSSHPGNEVELYDIATNKWEQQYQPECLPACCLGDTSCSDACRIAGGAATKILSPAGRPYVEHLYQRSAWDPVRRKFVFGLRSGTWSFDPSTKALEQLTADGEPPSLPWYTGIQSKLMMFDPEVGTVIWIIGTDERRAYRFNWSNRTWIAGARIPSEIPGGSEIYSAYDSQRQRHLVSFREGGMWFYDAPADTWTVAPTVPGLRDLFNKWPSSLDYDPVSRRFLIAISQDSQGKPKGEIDLWTFDGVSQWVKLTPNGTLPRGQARFNVLRYDPTNQIFFFLAVNSVGSGGEGGTDAGDVETWVYRLGDPGTPPAQTPTSAPGAGTPTRTPTVTRTHTRTPTAPAGSTPTAPDGGVLSLPLTIQEQLPADDSGSDDVAGRARSGEPVTSGVPLADADGVASVAELAVRDSATGQLVPAQLRPLTYHASGNLQWVLVDVQASTAAGGTLESLRLERGTNVGGSNLATDAGGTIAIDTGAARFVVRKAFHNLLDRVTVGGVDLVSSGHDLGIRYTDDNGVLYRATLDNTSTAVIEENGPLRSVVRATGRLVSSNGTRTLGYTARLSFYKNKAYVKSAISIDNAFRDQLTRITFRNIEARLPLTLGAGKTFTLGGQDSVVTDNLSSGAAYVYQANTKHKRDSLAVRRPNATSFFQEENDFGIKLTDAVVDAPNQLPSYPTDIVGKNLILSVDGGPDRTITFELSDFPRVPFRPKDVADTIERKVREQAGRDEIQAQSLGTEPGALDVLRLISTGAGGRPSVVVKGGSANAYLHFPVNVPGQGENGYTIARDGHTYVDFGGEDEYARGFGNLKDGSGRGVTVAMRDFDAFFPSAIEVTAAGDVAVELFSKRSNHPVWRFDWGVHETREILWDFHTSPVDPELTHYRIQYPLFARVPMEQYRVSGGMLGRKALLSYDQMRAYHSGNVINGTNQFAQANYGTFAITEFVLPNQQIVRTRSFNWGSGGRQTNNDYSVPKVLSFLATGKGGYYQTAYNLVRFVVDQAIHRSDAEDRTAWPTGLEDTATGSKLDIANGFGSKFEGDMEHQHVLAVPLIYFLTGDESIRDGLIDHAEWFLRERPVNVNCNPGGRGHAQRAMWLSIIWELTKDARLQSPINNAIDNYLCSIAVDPTVLADTGFDMTRGYVWREDSVHPRHISVGPSYYVRAEGMFELMRVLPASDPRKEELADRITGLAYFAAREGYFDRNGSPCNGHGSPLLGSDYMLDQAPTGDGSWFKINMYDHTPLMAHGYEQTRDPLFLQVGRRIVGAMGSFGRPHCDDGTGGQEVVVVRQFYSVYAGFGAQEMMYYDLNRQDADVMFVTESNGLTVSNNGGGSWTLRWTVPENASRYQIKYGPQLIVPNLNFDKFTRAYQHDPNSFDNFWAGNGEGMSSQPRNVMGEPAPGPAGTQQSHTISGLSPNQTYRFALRIEIGGHDGPPVPPRPPSAPTLL